SSPLLVQERGLAPAGAAPASGWTVTPSRWGVRNAPRPTRVPAVPGGNGVPRNRQAVVSWHGGGCPSPPAVCGRPHRTRNRNRAAGASARPAVAAVGLTPGGLRRPVDVRRRAAVSTHEYLSFGHSPTSLTHRRAA